MAERYSNADIMNAFIDFKSDVAVMKSDIKVIKEQALKTNGRVNTVEQWMNGIMAVEAYKKEQGPQVAHADTVIMQQKWFQNEKLVSGVVGVLLAVAAAIGFFVGGGSP